MADGTLAGRHVHLVGTDHLHHDHLVEVHHGLLVRDLLGPRRRDLAAVEGDVGVRLTAF